jgi:transposase
MGAQRKFSAKYKRKAVAMLEAPGVTVHQIAEDLGIGANILGWWQRELRQAPTQACVGNGWPRDKEISQLRRELTRVTKERDFLREAAADSTGRGNTCPESIRRGFISQYLSGPLIQLLRDPVELGL